MSNFPSHSPPPLRHPVPTYPAYIPEPPATPVWGMNDATAQFSMQLGQSAVAAGQEYVQRNFGSMFPASTAFKHHFNVSNSYVVKKISLLLFPWLHKPWSRRIRRLEHGQMEWHPPRDDVNSPDLYIPVMALLTYVLLAALLSSTKDPKVLGETASRAFGVVLLDFLFVKLGCYFLNVQGSSQVVDLVAYSGYKFIGVILTLSTSLVPMFPSFLWKLVFLYAFLANAFFLLRSLRSVVLPDPSISISTNPTPTTTATVNPAQRRRRIGFLFLVAVCQIVYMGILVRV
ncbi:hypothetical protein AX16_000686 [Volvariella volvacea WC 439]|nr:hypothetical protein AX16_000686 [Volvariella volvacea WC 439]